MGGKADSSGAKRSAPPRRGSTAELMRLLEETELFGSLTTAARRAVAAEMTRVDVPAGTVLLERGQPGDALYVVVRGRLQVLAEDGQAVVAEIAAGQVVGELALLSRRPRNATVRAARDTSLLRLDVEAFDRLVGARPAALLSLARTIVDRLEADSTARTAPVRTIAVVAAGRGVLADLGEFARELAVALAPYRKATVVDAEALDAAIGPGASDAGPSDPRHSEVARRLDTIERECDMTVHVGDRDHPGWTERCLREADLVLLVADAHGDPAVGPSEEAPASRARRHLVLLHRAGADRPTGTAAWLELRPDLVAHHHVRAGRPDDLARVARRVTGRAVGVVFGGGGPRGFAHLGVIQALEEAGVAVDMAGGASIGSMVAALCGFAYSAEERLAHMEEALARRGLFRPTLPMVSLTSSKRITKMLRFPQNLGETQMEDFWVPWHCVSTNLSRGRAVVHDRGPAWRAVRASIALPGFLPPVHEDGDLLVDGGVLNNLPVDAMRDRLDGRIVAIDLEPAVDLRYEDAFEPTVSGWRVLTGKLLPTRAPRVPNLVQIVMRAKQVGGVHAQRWVLAEHAVDLYLQPPIESFGALNFKAGPGLVDAAYRFTAERLASGALADLV